MMTGIKNWKERHDPVMSLCALYINEEHEDRRDISEEQIKAKVADWKEAGIAYDFFLLLASALLKAQKAFWNDSTPTSSEKQTSQSQTKE
jgi:hypothetical protein